MPIRFLINIAVVVNFYDFYLNYEYKYSALFSLRYCKRFKRSIVTFLKFIIYPFTMIALLILFPKIFYFSAHNGVSAVDQNPRSEFRLMRSIHYDAYTYVNTAVPRFSTSSLFEQLGLRPNTSS